MNEKTLIIKVKVNNDYAEDVLNIIENITVVTESEILQEYND